MDKKTGVISPFNIVILNTAYVALTGNLTAGVLLSQACYWSKINQAKGGWFYKTQHEWESELYLSRYQQESARKILSHFPFWQEKMQGCPAQLYFRIDFDILSENIENSCKNPLKIHSMLKTSKQVCGKPANKYGENQQTSMGKTSKLYKEASNTYIEYLQEVGGNTELEKREPILADNPPPLSEQSKEQEQPTKIAIWDGPRIELYRLLFSFHGACDGSLGLGPLNTKTGHPEEFLGAIPAVTERGFADLLRKYAKKRGIGLVELRESLLILGAYLKEKIPFVFKTKPVISLDAIIEQPRWFDEWIAEAIAWDQNKNKSRSSEEESLKKIEERERLMNEIHSEEHHSMVKDLLGGLKEKLGIW
jgi:hypothetical protein